MSSNPCNYINYRVYDHLTAVLRMAVRIQVKVRWRGRGYGLGFTHPLSLTDSAVVVALCSVWRYISVKAVPLLFIFTRG